MARIPVIIALDKRPVKSGGGPAGIAYRLLKGLLKVDGFAPYCLSANEAKIWKLENVSDLDAIALEFYPSLAFGSFRRILKRVSLLRTPYHFYRYKASLLHPKNKMIGNVIADILSGGKGVLNLHGALPPATIPESVLAKDNLSIIWSEHSKGGVTREWEQAEGSQVRNWLSYRVLQNRYSFLIGRSNCIVFPSWGAVDLFESYNGLKIPRDKLIVIYNGVEDPIAQSNSLNISPTPGLFVTVAEHVPEKGLDFALEGLALLKRPWKWYVVGGLTYWTNTLLSAARHLGVEDRVRFLGRLPHRQVLDLIARAEIVIMTQRVAVFDLVIIEAMSLGKPIFATPVGGNIEALGENYPFFVSSSEELAQAIEAISPYEAQQIGLRNRKRYETYFTEKVMLESYVSIYSEIAL